MDQRRLRRLGWRVYGVVWELSIAVPVFACALLAALLLGRSPWWAVGVGALLWVCLRVGIEIGWWAVVRLIRWGQERTSR